MHRTIPLIISLCLFIGCATTTKKYSAICNTWLNHDVNELIDKWGYPSQSFQAPNGNTVYVFYRASQEQEPAFTIPAGRMGSMTMGGEIKTRYCKTFFETTQSGIIIKWRYEGNACN